MEQAKNIKLVAGSDMASPLTNLPFSGGSTEDATRECARHIREGSYRWGGLWDEQNQHFTKLFSKQGNRIVPYDVVPSNESIETTSSR